jgi:hypothetical protein
VSNGASNSINVASTLAARQNMAALPSYFRVIT